MAELTPTRRGLLGAMAIAAPAAFVAGTIPVVAASSNTWDAVMRRYLAAKAAHDAEWAAYKRRNGVHSDAQSELLDRLSEEYGDLKDQLLEMPAPHAKAVLWKAEYILDSTDDGYTGSWRADVVRPFLNDLKRLAA